MSYLNGTWSADKIDAPGSGPLKTLFAVGGGPRPEFVTLRNTTGASAAVSRKNADGSWTFDELIIDEPRFKYQVSTPSCFPVYAERDSGGALYAYWDDDQIPGSGNPPSYYSPVLVRKAADGTTSRHYLPKGTLAGAGESGGKPWAVICEEYVTRDDFSRPTTDFRIWLIVVQAEGRYATRLLSSDKIFIDTVNGSPATGYISNLRAKRSGTGDLDVLWLEKPEIASGTGAALRFLRLPGTNDPTTKQ